MIIALVCLRMATIKHHYKMFMIEIAQMALSYFLYKLRKYCCTQLYISTRPDETSKLSKLTECVKNIKDWMTNNFLLLNSDKTEILLTGPKNRTQNILDHNLQLDGCTVTSSAIKNVGVILDSNLSFDNHISHVPTATLIVFIFLSVSATGLTSRGN